MMITIVVTSLKRGGIRCGLAYAFMDIMMKLRIREEGLWNGLYAGPRAEENGAFKRVRSPPDAAAAGSWPHAAAAHSDRRHQPARHQPLRDIRRVSQC